MHVLEENANRLIDEPWQKCCTRLRQRNCFVLWSKRTDKFDMMQCFAQFCNDTEQWCHSHERRKHP